MLLTIRKIIQDMAKLGFTLQSHIVGKNGNTYTFLDDRDSSGVGVTVTPERKECEVLFVHKIFICRTGHMSYPHPRLEKFIAQAKNMSAKLDELDTDDGNWSPKC